MTNAQRAKFFGTWWPEACAAQGWDPKDEAKRRALVLEATGGVTDSMSACTQPQLTRVFELTWHKADPLSLKAALPVANPTLSEEADEQRRAVYALSHKGVTLAEIARIAEPLCRRHRVSDWTRLPSRVLKEMTRWKQFQRTTGGADEAPREYQMRPRRLFQRKAVAA